MNVAVQVDLSARIPVRVPAPVHGRGPLRRCGAFRGRAAGAVEARCFARPDLCDGLDQTVIDAAGRTRADDRHRAEPCRRGRQKRDQCGACRRRSTRSCLNPSEEQDVRLPGPSTGAGSRLVFAGKRNRGLLPNERHDRSTRRGPIFGPVARDSMRTRSKLPIPTKSRGPSDAMSPCAPTSCRLVRASHWRLFAFVRGTVNPDAFTVREPRRLSPVKQTTDDWASGLTVTPKLEGDP